MKNTLSLVTGASLAVLSSSCSDIVFATRTSVGLEVAGDAAKVPDHVNLGFRRREFIYQGPGSTKGGSLLGKIDSETTWTQGTAIRETFATGRAATIVASDGDAKDVPEAPQDDAHQPLVFASRTKVGLGINFGGADDDAVPSGYLGYSRRIATRVSTRRTGPVGKTASGDLSSYSSEIPPGNQADSQSRELPSVVADVSLHSSSLMGGSAAGTTSLAKKDLLSPSSGEKAPGGVRIRQMFATGKAAEELVTKNTPTEKAAREAAGNEDGKPESIAEGFKSVILQSKIVDNQ